MTRVGVAIDADKMVGAPGLSGGPSPVRCASAVGRAVESGPAPHPADHPETVRVGGYASSRVRVRSHRAAAPCYCAETKKKSLRPGSEP